jgi:hypothetical protein
MAVTAKPSLVISPKGSARTYHPTAVVCFYEGIEGTIVDPWTKREEVIELPKDGFSIVQMTGPVGAGKTILVRQRRRLFHVACPGLFSFGLSALLISIHRRLNCLRSMCSLAAKEIRVHRCSSVVEVLCAFASPAFIRFRRGKFRWTAS